MILTLNKNKLSLQHFVGILIVSSVLIQCSEESLIEPTEINTADSIKVSALAVTSTAISCSSCTYVVPANQSTIDGKALGLKPGAVICFNAAFKYTNSLTFKNIIGTADKPIIITNCGGTVNLTVSGRPYNFKTSNSQYFRITGGNTNNTYGLRISGSTANGLILCERSTNFEVDHVEVFNVGFAGVMAKTDPTCDNATIRGNFTMRNIAMHHNYVHHTGGEGFYIGHTSYGGYSTSCGIRLPHTIEGSKIHNNVVKYTGWDGIQLSCATKESELYANTIENYGTKNKADQNYGILLGSGTGGSCFGNFIKGGSGTALTAFGLGDNIIHNNIIVDAGKVGIFCDERTTTFGGGYKIMNNTIINPKAEGMRIYSEKVPLNVVINNIVVNPGSFATYGNSAFIMKLSSVSRIEMTNNYTTRNIADVKFVNASGLNFRLTSSSPSVNKGKSIASYNISKDFYNSSRLKGSIYDIGASEY